MLTTHRGWGNGSRRSTADANLIEARISRTSRFAYNYQFAGRVEEVTDSSRGGTGVRMIMDVTEIQRILPHRYPFLMVDAIEEMEPQKRIIGVKNVTINESYFQGHFPGKPIMPGVLILEAMAQTGGLLLLLQIPDRDNKLMYFVAIDGARFRRPVSPGDQLKIDVTVLSWRGDFCKLDGKATVNGQLAAEATLMCKMVEREPRAKLEKIAK
ncbi:MAG TPA: 3-hydroxyacyl-ACP dehydratase FabZ [Candidatus Dormibacteraeota bacterium]|nr:3-hydroxyacyl-ACP dehydratase FabZ [Candidatus Dormibacteraeota bacterium]